MALKPLVIAARFLREEDGQDLIEYGLLTAIITVASLLAFASIQAKIGPAYSGWQNTGKTNYIPLPPT